jgi:Lipase (class 3)
MLIDRAIAPSYSTLRPTKPIASPTFPVYGDLGATLARVRQQPDPTVAHTLAVAAGYAYSDAETVAMMLARMGLADNHCLRVAMSVDAMFIESTAHVVQSSDGSVVIVAYRGTEPMNLVNWLTDADVHPDKIALRFADAPELYAVHGGFYRNVRATRFEVIAALKRALEGRSVLDDDTGASPMPPMAGPMTTLYLTGHSLGGAMAALMAVMLSVDEDYVERFAPVFKGAYTYGAPMVGSPDFAKACATHRFLNRNVVRYVYKRDPVPHLPPRDSDYFQHFGREYRYEGSYPWKDTSDDPIRQIGNLIPLIEAPLAFVARQFRLLRGLPFQFSLGDHGPQHYISAITPPEVPNEFGDAYLIPAT